VNSKKLNILLADDDADDCLFFKNALEGLPLPIHLTTVHNGEQLMNYLSGNTSHPGRPDVIFLDINMPRKTGLECLSEIKQNTNLKDIPVIIFSTSNPGDRAGIVFKMGADIYIHKPGDFSQLKQVLLHAIPIAVEKVYSTGSLKYILNA
jgi:CheY-like chemotaxis protein